MKKLFFVIGASGSGKTTILKRIEKANSLDCQIFYFDSIGVPSLSEMMCNYGSLEEWQRVKTIEWVKFIKDNHLAYTSVILDGQTRPSFIEEACQNNYVSHYEIILFDCSDEERAKRLIERGQPELVNPQMMKWASYLRKECQKQNATLFDNTHQSLEETLHLFLEWLDDHRSLRPVITESLVQTLIAEQFPQWSHLPIEPVEYGGVDNRTFRLGQNMSIRLPSAEGYQEQVHKEQKWLPRLAPYLSYPIPTPVAMGKPSTDYPWYWSVYRWIEGESANTQKLDDGQLQQIAFHLARFLNELHTIETKDGPLAGLHNYYRGSSPVVYDREARAAISQLKEVINTNLALSIWERAIRSNWRQKPVWIHGDLSAGNLLLKDQRLVAIIDFGCMGVGDPACDLVIAWTLLRGQSRQVFKSSLKLDNETWERARGWALWKALITLAALKDKDSLEAKTQLHLIQEILDEHE